MTTARPRPLAAFGAPLAAAPVAALAGGVAGRRRGDLVEHLASPAPAALPRTE